MAATAAIHVEGRTSPAGTGVLIEANKVLTCRHVVAGGAQGDGDLCDAIEVRLPGQPAVPAFPEVEQWLGVDAVVLNLDEAVAVAPAVLSGSYRPPAKVEMIGYPQADWTGDGVWRSFSVHGPTASGQVQLDWDQVGSEVGQSGGPVLDEASGKLVGLLRQGSVEGRFDRYIPLRKLVEAGVLERVPWLVDGDDAEGHFTRRSQGRRGVGGHDVFTGRVAALARISGWLTSEQSSHRPLVVTGQPGAGKSAVTARAGLDIARLRRDDRTWRGLLFHARAADITSFRVAVADLFGSDADGSHHALGDEIDRIAEASPDRRWVIIVDGLDEAPDPSDREEIAALARNLAQRPGIRVVVATRPLSASGPLGHDSLLRKLGVTTDSDEHLLNLDADTYFEKIDAENLAVQLLTQADQKYPRPGVAAETYINDSAMTTRLARVIAETARRNFLICAMTAGHLADLPDAMDPAAAQFDVYSLPTSIGEALARFLDAHPAGTSFRELLTALAYAQGAGMDDGTWLACANGLGYAASRADLDRLRRSRVADYLLQTSLELEGRATRLFHQALVDQLLRGRDHRSDQKGVVSALVRLVPDMDWARADRYTLNHLATHAVAADELDTFVDQMQFVVHADPSPLAKAIVSGRRISRVGQLYLNAHSAFSGSTRPAQRASQMLLNAVWSRDQHLASQLRDLVGDWDVLWSARSISNGFQFSGLAYGSKALAVLDLADGPALCVTDGQGWVRTWDLRSRRMLHPPIECLRNAALAMAAGRLNDRPIVAIAGRADDVVLFDPIQGDVVRRLRWSGGAQLRITMVSEGPRPMVVITSESESLAAWDLAAKSAWSATQPRSLRPLDGWFTEESEVTYVNKTGETDRLIFGPFAYSGNVYSEKNICDVFTYRNQPVVVRSSFGGGDFGWAYCHDFPVRELHASPKVLRDNVSLVRGGTLNGQAFLVSAHTDGSVHCWSENGESGEILSSNTHSVVWLSLSTVSDRLFCIASRENGELYVLDMQTRAERGRLHVRDFNSADLAVFDDQLWVCLVSDGPNVTVLSITQPTEVVSSVAARGPDLPPVGEEVTGLKFSPVGPSGALYIGTVEGGIERRDGNTGHITARIRTSLGSVRDVEPLPYSGTASVLVAGTGGLALANFETGNLRMLSRTKIQFQALSVRRQAGDSIILTDLEFMEIYSWPQYESQGRFKFNPESLIISRPVIAIVRQMGPKLVIAGQTGSEPLVVVDLLTGEARLGPNVPAPGVQAMCTAHMNGRAFVALSSGNDIWRWEVGTQSLAGPIGHHTAMVMDLAFVPAVGALVTGGLDGQVIAWDLISGERRGSLVMDGSIDYLAASSDTAFVATRTSLCAVRPLA